MRIIRCAFVSIMAVAVMGPELEASESAKSKKAVSPVTEVSSRLPLIEAKLRGTIFDLSRYHNQIRVVRDRTKNKEFASFVAEPHLLSRGAVMVFEVRSVAKTGIVPRWRCIATNDVAECLGSPVRVRYLPDDTRIELRAQLKPGSELNKLRRLASR